jgi:hypothetical protein
MPGLHATPLYTSCTCIQDLALVYMLCIGCAALAFHTYLSISWLGGVYITDGYFGSNRIELG